MLNVDLNNPADVRNAGMKVLREALGPVGMVKFIKQFDLGYGDKFFAKQMFMINTKTNKKQIELNCLISHPSRPVFTTKY